MPPVSVLIKPASSSCNLRCKYCFYADEARNRKRVAYGIMSESTLETLVKSVLKFGDQSAQFAFQGGEPTLAGLDFFKKLICLEEKYNTKKLEIRNSIQTNGIVIDEEWAAFLAEHHFLVGISLDGPQEIHDLNRLDPEGTGSFRRVLQSIRLFNRYQVEYNILCVVTNALSRHPEKVYRFFRKNGFCYLQFIPCLDGLGAPPGQSVYSLRPENYGAFLKKLFDLWLRDRLAGKFVSIRLFDNILNMCMGYAPEACDMQGRCTASLVVEADGSVYPCDFYVLDEWKLGQIGESLVPELLRGQTARRFEEVSLSRPEACGRCPCSYFCRGGCRRNYEPIHNGALKQNYFCSAYSEFYRYALPGFEKLARFFVAQGRF